MYDNRTHSVPDRIVSVSQPFVRPIVRGKAGKPVSLARSWTSVSLTDGRGWSAVLLTPTMRQEICGKWQSGSERGRGITPAGSRRTKSTETGRISAYCKAHGIRLSSPALGRPKKGETRDKAQDYRDECERVEVERRFSLAKRKCGMGLVTAKLRETAAHVIAMSVLVLNLRKIQRALLRMLAYLLEILAQNKNWALVQ